MRNSQDQSHARTMTQPQNFILRDRKDNIRQGIVAQTTNSVIMNLFANDILVRSLGHSDEVDHTVIKADQNFL